MLLLIMIIIVVKVVDQVGRLFVTYNVAYILCEKKIYIFYTRIKVLVQYMLLP